MHLGDCTDSALQESAVLYVGPDLDPPILRVHRYLASQVPEHPLVSSLRA